MMPLIYQSPVFFFIRKRKAKHTSFLFFGKKYSKDGTSAFWLSDQNANRDRGPILRQTT